MPVAPDRLARNRGFFGVRMEYICYRCECVLSLLCTGHLMENEHGTDYYQFCEKCSKWLDKQEAKK